ncbi:DELLA protein RGL1-like [Alnus glutinosa]|uniref:DELLA protein RGL1-like n=1 Tax=Alnus glutinosa TaxID=3517 RepID=UPI002D76D668|nr:DELLA protein RGL1-like [Alnus glutinosa]
MQALAERRDCPIELLKITAVGSTGIEETGKRLANVAESLNLPFSFKPVLLPDMNDVKDELFETKDDEYVIIFRSTYSGDNDLKAYMLGKLDESDKKSLSVDHALFFYSAYYDSFDTCLKQYDADRMRMETVFGDAIRNIVAEEGAERNIRNVTMDVWRAFFARYRMVEIGFSEAALSQASLVVKRFACRSSCTIDKNGKCDIAKKGAHLLKDQLQHYPKRRKQFQNLLNTIDKQQMTQHPLSSASLKLLRNYGSGKRELISNDIRSTSDTETCGLSTEEAMRVAGARYVQFSIKMYDDNYMPMHPFGFALSGLSEDEKSDVELVHFLLSAADNVGYRQYDRAGRLVLRCEWMSSARANPVQRVVFHFAQALRERIENESPASVNTLKGFQQKNEMIIIPTFLTVYKQLPFTQILLFAGIQAILENIAFERKIHLIDLGIRCGVHWTILMQALAERTPDCPIELLKITAVGSSTDIEETGKRLASVAESLNLPFSFKSVLLSDMKHVKEELFETEDDEAVIVLAPLILRIMVSRPSCLENLMTVIKSLNPSMMVVIEIEANHNSPTFVNRFIEALFYFSALNDGLQTCMKQYDEDRMRIERALGGQIRNIVAKEGRERTVRNVTMDVWRVFFARFRMVEIGFSETSLFQASSFIKLFACRSSCTIDQNGKCLIVGWKGTPIHSLSLWKFP